MKDKKEKIPFALLDKRIIIDSISNETTIYFLGIRIYRNIEFKLS